ncbi:ATP-dependent DNA helicase RecQ [Paucimonas lemoignei]|uniref:ATP-dependent DNA helicase RecQ n=1 Tax=Paucimonas lemoignei TaxID=29443 RepID=A0A4R3I0Z8_PAULE|nr:ATP-dependent DNA helicase RecQ [Paucimonas lemoignei]TCS38663.1 ATP-dependent DNA helicase RecQ [Paucimonas lemoignei]
MTTSPVLQESLTEQLQEVFGITELRPGQREVIDSVLQGHDTLAIMPTGSGKSLCYQLPALNLPGTTVVVSPLISLMKDQTEKLEESGVDAAQINSTLSEDEEQSALRNIARKRMAIVFATPERMTDPEFLASLKRAQVSLFVVDEAHCISQWGHDFRPAYLQLGHAIETLGRPPVLALTATATPEVIEDITHQLKCRSPRIVNTGIYRPNLHYEVVRAASEAEKLEALHALLGKLQGSGIIYTATVRAAEELHEALKERDIDVALYHGRMPVRARSDSQERFMQGETRIMIATNAFGMGIDKADIRFVIHFQVPGSLGAYYQEAGRAGRDGEPAKCILIFHDQDKRIQQFFLAHHYPDEQDLRAVLKAMEESSHDHAPVKFEQLRECLTKSSKTKLQIMLKLLQDGGLVESTGRDAFRRTESRADALLLEQLVKEYRRKGEHDRYALERMVFYAQTGFCRWKVLLEYFDDEVQWQRCGSCDNCLHPPEKELTPLARSSSSRPNLRSPVRKRNAPAFVPGSRVTVPKFGEGKVQAVAGDQITILFPDSRSKTFLQQYVRPLPKVLAASMY